MTNEDNDDTGSISGKSTLPVAATDAVTGDATTHKTLTAVIFAEDALSAKITRLAGILLQAAQLAGLAALVVDAGRPDLAIVARNRRADTLVPNMPVSLREAGGISKMTFFDLHSHMLLVAAGADDYRGTISLLGDPLASRRRVALLKLLSDVPDDHETVLLIGPSISWHDAEDPTAADPFETLLRLHRIARG